MRVPLNTCLTTPRCLLRYAGEDDLEHVWSATRYPGFNDGMPWGPPGAKSEIFRWTERNLEMWSSGGEYVFTIRSRTDNRFIGRVAIRREQGEGVWSIGFWIHPECWRQGFVTEASQSVIEFGFGRLGANKIVAAHAIWNTASKRVMQKLGLKYVRDNSRGFKKDHEWVAEAEYEIDRDSWKYLRSRPGSPT